AKLAGWLAPRGLTFNEDKTQVVSIDDGFDFLGFNVRRYNGKLLIKPSAAAVKRIRERLRAEMRALRGANSSAVSQTIRQEAEVMDAVLIAEATDKSVRDEQTGTVTLKVAKVLKGSEAMVSSPRVGFRNRWSGCRAARCRTYRRWHRAGRRR
ncbi:MAG: hypothetical protein ACNA7M_13580, partial [Roseovarius sp.]